MLSRQRDCSRFVRGDQSLKHLSGYHYRIWGLRKNLVTRKSSFLRVQKEKSSFSKVQRLRHRGATRFVTVTFWSICDSSLTNLWRISDQSVIHLPKNKMASRVISFEWVQAVLAVLLFSLSCFVCCSVWQFFAECCSVLQCVAEMSHRWFTYSSLTRVWLISDPSMTPSDSLLTDDDCFYYHSWRNNVVFAFGTLSSYLT